jgi:hypothetical protein
MKDQPLLEVHKSTPNFLKRISTLSIAVSVSIAVLFCLSGSAFADPSKRVDVLELFTSQGCSSCPPADANFRQLSKGADILALSFPVSYWDYLGWKDTLAKEAYNKRQYAYAEARGDREIYTPQMIVNGITHVVGSRLGAVEAALQETRRTLEPVSVPVSIELHDDSIRLAMGAAPEESTYRSGKVWVVCYSQSVDVAIGRGENRGRKITYTNVVRELIPAGSWNGQESSLSVVIPEKSDFDNIGVILQADKSHAMLGAAALPLRSR